MRIPGPSGSELDIDYEPVEAPRGTAIAIHGLGGFKEQSHIVAMAEAYRACGYSTVRMNTRHAFVGDGSAYEHATITASVEDLNAVATWVEAQAWHDGALVLAGHSLGGISVLEVAHTHGADLIIPASPVVTGTDPDERYDEAELREWRETGWRASESASRPGSMKRLRWRPFEADLRRYDVMRYASELEMPSLVICGSLEDDLDEFRALAEAMPDAQIHIIDGAPHTYRTREQLEDLRATIEAWLRERAR